MWNPLTLLSSIQTYLIIGAVSALLAASGGAYAGYRWEAAVVARLQRDDAQAIAKAIQAQADSDARQAQVNLTAALEEQVAQGAIHERTLTITQEISLYVHNQIPCPGPTIGLARVLRAAAEGSDPGALRLAAGQSDDDCSDVAPSEVAGWFTAYAGASRGNAEQLNALEAEIVANHAAQVGPR